MADTNKKSFFTPEEESKIINAIQEAERQTSGEIKVHVEEHCYIDLLDRTSEVFAKLNMHETELRNGTLIYIAMTDHLFAIIGDIGINRTVEENFWDEVRDLMEKHFKEGNIVTGISLGVLKIGEKLKKYFPYQDGDENELTDDISYS